MTTLQERIGSRLQALGISATAASQAAGLGKDFIRDIERGKKKTINTEAAAELARVLKCNVEWLLGGESVDLFQIPIFAEDPPFEPPPFGIRYGGIVEAGAFRSQNDFDQADQYRTIAISPDTRYPKTSQFAFAVVGDSMTRERIFEGMYVHAVEVYAWERIHGEPRDGLLVVVERRRNGSTERELTIKKLRIFRDRYELQPCSDNPEWKPIVIPLPQREDEVLEGEVKAVVIAATWVYGA